MENVYNEFFASTSGALKLPSKNYFTNIQKNFKDVYAHFAEEKEHHRRRSWTGMGTAKVGRTLLILSHETSLSLSIRLRDKGLSTLTIFSGEISYYIHITHGDFNQRGIK